MTERIFVATDVGGTFTDLICFSEDLNSGIQQIKIVKTDTTPPNFEQGVFNVMKKGNVNAADIDIMAHGTTVVINALTERKGAVTALITTQGFRDILEIGRGNRPDFFNLKYQKPKPYVPRYLRFQIEERIAYNGSVDTKLNLDELPAILEKMKQAGVEAIAICLLNAYINSSHEKAIADAIKAYSSHFDVICSHQISREWREYERTSTTVLSAYIKPIATRYLENLNQGLIEQNFKGQMYVMQSNCGVDTLNFSKQVPITMVESGPASGFWGAAALGEIIGEKNIIALDIGGTTAKCTLINDGKVPISSDYYIERSQTSAGYPIMIPVVDLVEIGNGGGSIAWVDKFSKLHVGPQSAGAIPGPVAYGRGGNKITTTDANLVLGRINPDYFCGGEIKADMTAVAHAFEHVAKQLDLSVAGVAQGIIRIANNNMVNALKLVSINRGHDPRDFSMVAFGGGGAMHACALAMELGIKKVIIPATASVFSAWGMLMSDIRRDRMLTYLKAWQGQNISAINVQMEQLKNELEESFVQEHMAKDKINYQMYGRFRYQNQEHSIEVPLPDFIYIEAVDNIEELFKMTYEKEYTYRLDTAIELVGLHLIAQVDVGKIKLAKKQQTGRLLNETIKGERQVDYALEGVHNAVIYNGDLFEPYMAFKGPAIIEQTGTTIVVHPHQQVNIDEYINIIISI